MYLKINAVLIKIQANTLVIYMKQLISIFAPNINNACMLMEHVITPTIKSVENQTFAICIALKRNVFTNFNIIVNGIILVNSKPKK